MAKAWPERAICAGVDEDTKSDLQECVLSTKMVDNSLCSSVMKSPSARTLSPSAAKLRLLKTLRCTLRYEKKAWATGARMVAGVDEVGRGSLFGCVVAAAVILDPAYRVRGLRDSKLLLPERREVLAERIREHAVAWAVAAVDAARIDQINIYHASRAAMREAVHAPRACGGSPARRRPAARLRAAAGSHHSWRRALGLDRGGVDPGEGGARSHDVRVGRGVSRVRSGFAQGIQHAASIWRRCASSGRRRCTGSRSRRCGRIRCRRKCLGLCRTRMSRSRKVPQDERVSGAGAKISTVFLQEHFYYSCVRTLL